MGEGSYLHLNGPNGGAASRQKRRSKVSRSTAARKVKTARRKVHPLAFTHNAL